MTITRTHLNSINDKELEILKHIAWGEYEDLSMSESDIECIKTVVGSCDKFFEKNVQEYNDVLGVIKNHIKNMEEGREVASFFESIMRDLTKGRSKLVMSVKDTIDKINKSVVDAGVTEDYEDVDSVQITVVSAITSALTMYFDDIEDEDAPEQITLTADDVIGIAADSSDKYREEVKDESKQEEEPVAETVMSSKEIAQAVIATGILDTTIEVMSTESGMSKMDIVELLVDVYEIMFDNIEQIETNQKEVVFKVGKILINRCSTADQMEKLNIIEIDKMVDLMLTDKLDGVDPQVAAALEKLGNALESNKEETDQVSGGKFEAIKKKAEAFNAEQKALTVKHVEEKKDEPSAEELSDAQLFRKTLLNMCDKYKPKNKKPAEERGKHTDRICLM